MCRQIIVCVATLGVPQRHSPPYIVREWQFSLKLFGINIFISFLCEVNSFINL